MRARLVAVLLIVACAPEPLHRTPGPFDVDIVEASPALRAVARASMARWREDGAPFDEFEGAFITVRDSSPEIPGLVNGETPPAWYEHDQNGTRIWLDASLENAPEIMDRYFGNVVLREQ